MLNDDLQIEQIAAPVTWRLRQEVLYPEGSLKDVMIDADFEGYHFGAYRRNVLVGVISLFRDDGDSFQFRKFAVHRDYQRQGVGEQLLSKLFAFAADLQAANVWCDARKEAVSFYQRFGLEPVGATFTRCDIEYIRLEIRL